MEYTKWYLDNIEPEIREVVKVLRDNGINTKGSCGHKMWVYCDWLDKEDISRTINALRDAGYIRFYVNAQTYINEEGIPGCSLRIEFDKNHSIKRDDMPSKGIATEKWRPISGLDKKEESMGMSGDEWSEFYEKYKDHIDYKTFDFSATTLDVYDKDWNHTGILWVVTFSAPEHNFARTFYEACETADKYLGH